jgi:hypothetical protein
MPKEMVHKTLQKTKYCNNSLTELLCPGIVSSSCSTSGTPCAHNVKNLIISFGLYYKIRIVFLEKFGNLSKVKVTNLFYLFNLFLDKKKIMIIFFF